jgi:3-methyl-2-oxobutanoate hydroxymethyltransferase
MPPMTVKELLACKGRKKLTMIAVNGFDDAQACELAGIDMLALSAANLKPVRAGAPNCFVRPAATRAEYRPSNESAIRECYSLIEQGGDAVHMVPGLERIRAVTKMKIPVFGHVGFCPDFVSWTGGFRAVGKTAVEALQVYKETLELQEAGVIGVEMEVVPWKIAAEISKRVDIHVSSLGSGAGCDSEMLFACDMLGTHNKHYPRHAKRYRNYFEDSVEVFRQFKQEVDEGSFPTKEYTVGVKDNEFDKFMNEVDKGKWV